MLKKILLLVLAVSSLNAQTIMTHQQYLAADTEWSAQYESQNNEATNAPLIESFRKILGSSFTRRSKEAQMLMLEIFLGKEGNIDYLVYQHFGNVAPDTVSYIIKNEARESLADFMMVGLNRKIRTHLFFRTEGTSPKLEKIVRASPNDSTLSTLEDLDSYSSADKIKKIDLTAYDLKAVPVEVYRFQNLRELVLSGNNIEKGELNLKRLPHLSFVMLDGNPLEELKITKSRALKRINFQRTALKRIPRSLKKAKNLNSLWLGFNTQIVLKRRDYRKIRQVRDLNLYGCSFKTLSPSIRHLKKLEVLDLYYNQLEYLPESITSLKKLTHLAISNNRLTILPEKIGELKELEYLYTHHNFLTKVPPGLGELTKLKVLDLGYNWFVEYPEEANKLRLTEMDLTSNKFSDFPEKLLGLRELEKIYLRGNPFLEKNSVTTTQLLEQLKSQNHEVIY